MKQFGVYISVIFLTACGSGGGGGQGDFKISKDSAPGSGIANEYIDDLPEEVAPQQMKPNGILKWHPTGELAREPRLSCRKEAIKNLHRESPHDEASALQSYFNQCEDELTFNTGNDWWSQLKMSNVEYDYWNTKTIQDVRIQLASGEVLRGMLGIKPGTEKYPLIIARCGVFCDIGNGASKTIMMHLFDENPFHVLVLASTTGSQFLEDNKYTSVGGYYEALQHIEIAKNLRSSEEYSNRISEIHVFGLSLGANSALMTSVLDSLEPNPLFSSSIAYCPVVNLEGTLREVFKNTVRGKFMASDSFYLLSRVRELTARPAFEKPDDIRDYPSFIVNEALAAYQRLALPINPLFEGLNFSNEDQVWRATQFNEFVEDVTVPTLLWASKDDPIVPQSKNTIPLAPDIQNLEKIGLVMNEGGKHCAQSRVYGWSITSNLIHNYYMKRSPSLEGKEQTERVALSSVPNYLRNLQSDEYIFAQKWKSQKGKNYLDLTYQVWSPRQYNICRSVKPEMAFEGCFKAVTSRVSLEQLKDFIGNQIQTPTTSAEAEALTRLANTQWQILDRHGRTPNYTRELPAYTTGITRIQTLFNPQDALRQQLTKMNLFEVCGITLECN